MIYKYNALNLLNSYEIEHFDTVIICCYYVYLNGKQPILSYLLQKDIKDEYNFITLENNNHLNENVKDIICYNLNQFVRFMGFKKYKNNLYAFYEFFENNTEIELKNNNFEKCLMYEILNTKKNKNTNISNNVVDFFYNNSFFSYLYDTNEQLIEIPIVAFKQTQVSKENYVLYNEILLEPNDDYYKLQLYFSNEEGYTTMRYAVFLQEFISLLDNNQKQIYTDLKSFDSIIISKSKEIYFKNKLQQLVL
jgi:hypothetical protein